VELVLALQEESQIRVTCDDHYSHTADLRPLLFQNEQEAKIIFEDPAVYAMYGRTLPTQKC